MVDKKGMPLIKATKALEERTESEDLQLIAPSHVDSATDTEAQKQSVENKESNSSLPMNIIHNSSSSPSLLAFPNGSPGHARGPSHLKLVEVRVEFITFGEVDTFNEQFKAHVLVRSRWFEDGQIEEYDPKKDWNPKLFVDNAIPEKYYEEIRYKLQQMADRTEITEIRTCKGFRHRFSTSLLA